MMKLFKNEDAFTGLEAAIVLIAFIVVAAVFSYVMLGAGFFATQEAQRTVHTGSQQASSSLEIIGNVYGKTTATTKESTASAHLQYIEFTIGNTAGGTPIDITQMLVTFVCGTTSVVIPFDEKESGGALGLSSKAPADASNGKWYVTETYSNVGDQTTSEDNKNKLLEPGEQFVLKVAFPKETTAAKLTPNTRFSVNLQPAIGAAYPIKKTVPSTLYAVNIL
jgi:flagellin FlaB